MSGTVSWRAMNRHLLPKARLGAAQYWPPLENRVSNFKLTVLSRQKEFLSGTGTIGKLRFSSFTFYARLVCPTRFGTCKFGKCVARWSRNVPNFGSGSVIFDISDPGSHQNLGIHDKSTMETVDSSKYLQTPSAHQFW